MQNLLALVLVSWWTSLLLGQSPPPPPTPLKASEEKQEVGSNKTAQSQISNSPTPAASIVISQAAPIPTAQVSETPCRESRKESSFDYNALAVTIFTFGLVVLAYRQWKAAKKQARYMKDGLKLTQLSADASKISADASTKAAQAAEASVETARDISRRDQRAWLILRTVTMTTPLAVGVKPIIEVRFENSGRTPAVNVQSSGAVFTTSPTVQRDMLPGDRPIIGDVGRSIVGPGSGETGVYYSDYPIINEAIIKAIEDDKWVIYVAGSIFYDDIFGDHHRTNFCYCLSGREAKRLRMSAYSEGNTIT